ncbi:hypothetical protein ACNKHL_02865 [Shigella flexneri]
MMILHNLDSNVVASALNFVILVASLSVYNSGVYLTAACCFAFLCRVMRREVFDSRQPLRGVPINSLMLSGRSLRWWC